MVHFIFIAPMHSYVTNVLVYNLHMTIFSRVYSYVSRVYSYLTRMYSYVTRMYSYVTRMLTRMYSYVTRMYSYVTRMLFVCSLSHNVNEPFSDRGKSKSLLRKKCWSVLRLSGRPVGLVGS